MSVPNSGERPSGSPQRMPSLTFALSLSRFLGVCPIFLGGVFEPGDLVAQRIIEPYQRILHAGCCLRLRKAHLMLGNPQRLEHPVLVIAGEGERVGIAVSSFHFGRIRARSAAEKGRI